MRPAGGGGTLAKASFIIREEAFGSSFLSVLPREDGSLAKLLGELLPVSDLISKPTRSDV
jgi:hypothetical protein